MRDTIDRLGGWSPGETGTSAFALTAGGDANPAAFIISRGKDDFVRQNASDTLYTLLRYMKG